jgi:hypothetical protein
MGSTPVLSISVLPALHSLSEAGSAIEGVENAESK